MLFSFLSMKGVCDKWAFGSRAGFIVVVVLWSYLKLPISKKRTIRNQVSWIEKEEEEEEVKEEKKDGEGRSWMIGAWSDCSCNNPHVDDHLSVEKKKERKKNEEEEGEKEDGLVGEEHGSAGCPAAPAVLLEMRNPSSHYTYAYVYSNKERGRLEDKWWIDETERRRRTHKSKRFPGGSFLKITDARCATLLVWRNAA